MSSNVVPAMNISPITPIRFNGIFSVFPKHFADKENISLITSENYLSSSLFQLMGVSTMETRKEFYLSLHTLKQ